MPVDPSKPRMVLVVHGVQTSTDADINPHLKIAELIESRRAVDFAYETETYKYENINDQAQKRYRKVLGAVTKALTAKTPFGPLAGKIIDGSAELVGDVLIAKKNGSTAQQIRQGLVDRIEEIHREGKPLYIVAHSLGTIYAHDAINQLIGRAAYFDRSSRKTWPLQGLITMGSPLGLSMFKRNSVKSLGAGNKFLRWTNYWDRTDPVVTGSFYGKPNEGYRIVEKFTPRDANGGLLDNGWFVKDRVVDTGKVWLLAHTAYWQAPVVGDDLVTMITS
jgi:hypothetical protein